MTRFLYDGLIADLDGSLVPEGSHEVMAPVKDAFAHLSELMPIHIATGRTLEFCTSVFGALDVQTTAVVENGSRIIDISNGAVHRNLSLTAHLTAGVLSACCEVVPEVQCRISGDAFDVEGTVSERTARPNKGVFLLDLSPERAAEVMSALAPLAVHAYVSTAWGDSVSPLCDVNIHHPEANKGSALRALAAMHGYDLRRLIALGNDVNDLPMFDLVGLSVAPEDSHPQVLARADRVIPPAAELGFVSLATSLALANER